MDPQDDGFTLVELLVVMLIIGVLTAIAIPVFMTQRGKAYGTAMKADLKAIVLSEASWNLSHDVYTTDLALLQDEGYKASPEVAALVSLVGSDYVACTHHNSSEEWLVYDSATSSYSTAPAPCA